MAEIPIQRKEGHSLWWLWLLILVIVLAVAWYLWANHGTTNGTTADTTLIAPAATTPAADSAATRGATTAPRADSTAPR
jgi:hypothetical protein